MIVHACVCVCVCVCVRVCIVYIYMVFSWRVINENKSMIFMSVCPGGKEKNNICISKALERDRRETRLIYNIIHTHYIYICIYVCICIYIYILHNIVIVCLGVHMYVCIYVCMYLYIMTM